MIQVENITKKYGSFTAVNDISFEIEEGEIVGFLGPNGAGKSTTMNMITGFIEPTSGKIIVDGYNISKKPKKAKKSKKRNWVYARVSANIHRYDSKRICNIYGRT